MNTYTPNINIMQMMRNALNTLNYKLLDHAERVAYIVVEMIKAENKYSEEQMLEIAYIALLHDIGAFKTDSDAILSNTKRQFDFEMMNTDSHAIFSYLFLHHFTKLSDMTDALIYHHYTNTDLIKSSCKYKDLAAKIFLADKIDVVLRSTSTKDTATLYKIIENPVFNQDDVNLVKKLEEEKSIITKVTSGEFLPDIIAFFNNYKLNSELAKSMVEMLCFTIDFRSPHTLTHTLATVEISLQLARLHNLPEDELTKIYFGSLLHDIGKISTSLLVLEKNGKLDEIEFHYMKDHVSLSESILRGNIDEEIVEIAIRHHEKINGNGYPHNLKGDEINLSQRIVAIADIASALTGRRSYKEPFPKEKIIEIFNQMLDNNEICPNVSKVFFDNYEEILENVHIKSEEIANKYANISVEYDKLLKMKDKMNDNQ